MKKFHWLNIAIFFIVVSSLLPLAFTSAAQADSGKINLKDLTNGADSVLVGTVTDRNSYWNDEHTHIYTSVVMSVDDRLKGTVNQDKITITVQGGQAEGIREVVSEMPSFDQGEKAVVFLKKLTATQLHQAGTLGGQPSGEQYEVYAGFRGKFDIKGDRIDSLPLNTFKGRVNNILKGQVLSDTELYVTPPAVTMPFSVTGYRWTSDKIPVGYRINENTSDCTGEGAAAQNAAATWSTAGANFSFSYAGTTTAIEAGFDGVNEIMWKDMGGNNILAIATWWSYDGSTFAEADIEFNDYYSWSASPTCPPGYYDAQSIGLHELGHWVGLADLYGGGDADKVMYGYGFAGQTKRALTADDIAGIQSIYGASAPSSAQKLVGANDAAGLNESGNYILLTKFQAVATGQITEFKVKSGATAQVKVAIYADNSGEPGERLSYNDTAQNVVAGWNTLSIPARNVTSGTYYWLGIIVSGTGGVQYISGSSSNFRYKAASFAGFTWPDPAGFGYSNYAEAELVAGWGETGPAPLSITTTSLPDATVGVSYSQTVQASGGSGGYSWSITAGSLPAGFDPINSSTGVISGTPTTVGTSNFTVQVNDGSTTATKNLSIIVSPLLQKLVGANDAAATGNEDPNYFLLDKFTAEATGNVNQIRLKCGSSGNVKVAIYADSSGEPGDLLPNAFSASTPVVAGWNQISITSTPVTAGTAYWLACISDSRCMYYIYPGGTGRYKSASYSGFTFPGSAGSSFASWTGYHLIAGWGAPPLPPDAAPAITSPGASITFKWGTADRATTYWLQVNTQPDFGGTNIYNAEVGNVTTQEVSGFSVGTTYYWRVKAGNTSGWGPWSSVRSVLANTVP